LFAGAVGGAATCLAIIPANTLMVFTIVSLNTWAAIALASSSLQIAPPQLLFTFDVIVC
jgi:hypothetical protein